MTNHQEPHSPKEPSVWDYFVSTIQFWNRATSGEIEIKEEEQKPKNKTNFPWLSVCALIFALAGQLSFEPSASRKALPGILFYAIALGCLIIAVFRKEWHLTSIKSDIDQSLSTSFRVEFLLTGLVLAILAFLLFGNGLFGLLNTTLWVLSIIFTLLAFWQPTGTRLPSISSLLNRINSDDIKIKITRWGLILLAALAVV